MMQASSASTSVFSGALVEESATSSVPTFNDDDDDDDYTTNVPMKQRSKYSKSEMRARDGRRALEENMRRRPLTWCGGVLSLIALATIIVGVCEVSNAEHERKYGWAMSTCTIEKNYAHNDTMCIYFSVMQVGEGRADSVCAVPARITSEAWFHEAPACSYLNRVDRDEVEYWRQLPVNTQIECLIPVGDSHSVVSREQCVNSVVTRGPAAIVWRSWIEHMVYLLRTPREGAIALDQVTGVRRILGASMIIIGTIVLLLAALCACNKCVSRLTPELVRPRTITNFRQLYREKRAQARKLH